MSVLHNKQLIVMRQKMAGFAAQGEVTGYAKLEWMANRCRVQFGVQGLITQDKGEYLCAIKVGKEAHICGEISPSSVTNSGYKSFDLSIRQPVVAVVVCAGVFFVDKGFLYPVLCGNKGGDEVHNLELIRDVCKIKNLRQGKSYVKWSLAEQEASIETVESNDDTLGDTIEFQPIVFERISNKDPRIINNKPKEEPKEEVKAAEEARVNEKGKEQGQSSDVKETDELEWAWVEPGLNEEAPEFDALPEEDIRVTEMNFYNRNKEHFERLLLEHEPIEELKDMIPGSSWAKIEYKDGDEKGYYLVGIIYDENQKPLHICYGVPGTYSEEPPKGLSEYCQWIPARIEEPRGDGYWMLYQSAITGETIENR